MKITLHVFLYMNIRKNLFNFIAFHYLFVFFSSYAPEKTLKSIERLS